jgi:hypothetical protein
MPQHVCDCGFRMYLPQLLMLIKVVLWRHEVSMLIISEGGGD